MILIANNRVLITLIIREQNDNTSETPCKNASDNGWVSRLKSNIPTLCPDLAIAIFWLCGSCFLDSEQHYQAQYRLSRHLDTDFLAVYDRGGWQRLFWQIWASLQRVAISYSLAAIIGIGLGILIGTNDVKALDPIFQLLRTVPPLAWVPIALAALRQNEPTALFVIFITAIWPILINTSGVKQIPKITTTLPKF